MRRLRAHVEVYVFRQRGRRVEFLCLRRSAGRSLAGIWQPVTGKRKQGEPAVRAALREVVEETGVVPLRFWCLESVSVYYDPRRDDIHVLPLFAAEISARARVRLSAEHDDHRFLSAAAAGRLYLWEAQRRGLDAVRREVLARPKLAGALRLDINAKRSARPSIRAGSRARRAVKSR